MTTILREEIKRVLKQKASSYKEVEEVDIKVTAKTLVKLAIDGDSDVMEFILELERKEEEENYEQEEKED